MHSVFARATAAAAIALATIVGVATPALAHEHRDVGPLQFVVGWGNEPAYSGVQNSVSLTLSSGGKPVTDLGDGLKVPVVYGNTTSDPMTMEAAFGPTFGTPGEYEAAVLPTRPGTYTFHFTGAVHGQNVDQSFTSSDKTFDDVHDSTSIEFPVKDPSNAELATKLDRLDTRVAAVGRAAGSGHDKASTATTLGIAGIVVGAIGIALAGVALATRRSPQR